MAQNVTLLGADYPDVPSVILPKTGGGNAEFTDTSISDNAASASDIALGKKAYVNGSLVTGTNQGGGGSGMPLIKTYSLGTLATTSTSATPINKSTTISEYNDYDALVVDVSVDTQTNGRHTSTVSIIFITGTSNVTTKNTVAVATNKWNSQLNSSGTGFTSQTGSSYGIYPSNVTLSNGTLTIPFFYRYNPTNTGTINGSYTARIYGLKLYELIGG